MEKISNAIKCFNCKQVFTSPVILPCNHTVCHKHASSGETIQCGKCNLVHRIPPNRQFQPNEILAQLLDAQIETLDFGKCHHDVQDSCAQMDDLLQQIEQMIRDPVNFKFERVSELKNKIQLRKEVLMKKIEEESNYALERLDEYYQTRKEDTAKSREYVDECEKLEKEMRTRKEELAEWMNELNRLKFDEKRCGEIQDECMVKIAELGELAQIFESEFVLKEFNEIKYEIDLDDEIKININDSVFAKHSKQIK